MLVAIVNPTSANGKTAREWSTLQPALEAELGQIEVLLTETHLHAVELTKEALKSGAETVIAVGGDGTLNEVVNGFFEQGRLLNPSARLAVLMRGTGSDFARSCLLPRSIQELIAAIKTQVSHPCDAIRMTLEPLNGSPRERYYINIADVGVGGLVADLVNQNSKWLGGTLSFFLASLNATLFKYRNAPLRIELDGNVVSDNAPHYFVAVANGRYFGGRMHIAPDAKVNDGLFDVILVGNLTLPEKIYLATKLYQGKAGQLEKIRVLRGTYLTIASAEKVLIEADGELVGQTDVQFEMLPSAIRLVGLRYLD